MPPFVKSVPVSQMEFGLDFIGDNISNAGVHWCIFYRLLTPNHPIIQNENAILYRTAKDLPLATGAGLADGIPTTQPNYDLFSHTGIETLTNGTWTVELPNSADFPHLIKMHGTRDGCWIFLKDTADTLPGTRVRVYYVDQLDKDVRASTTVTGAKHVWMIHALSAANDDKALFRTDTPNESLGIKVGDVFRLGLSSPAISESYHEEVLTWSNHHVPGQNGVGWCTDHWEEIYAPVYFSDYNKPFGFFRTRRRADVIGTLDIPVYVIHQNEAENAQSPLYWAHGMPTPGMEIVDTLNLSQLPGTDITWDTGFRPNIFDSIRVLSVSIDSLCHFRWLYLHEFEFHSEYEEGEWSETGFHVHASVETERTTTYTLNRLSGLFGISGTPSSTFRYPSTIGNQNYKLQTRGSSPIVTDVTAAPNSPRIVHTGNPYDDFLESYILIGIDYVERASDVYLLVVAPALQFTNGSTPPGKGIVNLDDLGYHYEGPIESTGFYGFIHSFVSTFDDCWIAAGNSGSPCDARLIVSSQNPGGSPYRGSGSVDFTLTNTYASGPYGFGEELVIPPAEVARQAMLDEHGFLRAAVNDDRPNIFAFYPVQKNDFDKYPTTGRKINLPMGQNFAGPGPIAWRVDEHWPSTPGPHS